MKIELIMDVKLGILILLNMARPQKLVVAPGAIIRGNTEFRQCRLTVTEMTRSIEKFHNTDQITAEV